MQSEQHVIHSLRFKFWVFTGLSIIAVLLMRLWSHGITGSSLIDFEMAKTVEKASGQMSAWGVTERKDFLNSIYADFLFLVCYGAALFYGSRFMGHLSGHEILKKAGYFFSFLALLAATCDALENVAMIYTIKGRPISWVVHFTYDMALVKFSLVFIVLLFIVICLFFWVIDKLSRSNKKLKY